MDFSKKYKLGSETPLNVSQYIGFLNEVLKRIKAKVIGEVSGLQIAASGHVYFSLRDKKDGSVLRCIIWKSTYHVCGVNLKEGMEVIVSGYSDIYPNQGTLGFKVETIELVGEGALKKAYDELKEKLNKEGLFEKERKRPIPDYPRIIGVLTSLHSGTVIHDFISNLGKFGFKIKAIDSRVEGQEATKDLLRSIKKFKKEKIDVLVIIRGGGSLQSLMAFDNENLVREVANFPVPVIAGIGHHKDVTLTALVSDACESTPTAAANLLNKPWESTKNKVDISEKTIIENYKYCLFESKNQLKEVTITVVDIFNLIFENYKEIERGLKKNLFKIQYSLISQKNRIKDWTKTIISSFKNTIREKERYVQESYKLTEANNPEKQLKLGYAIPRHKGKVVKGIGFIDMGDQIDLEVTDGIIITKTIDKNKN